MTKDINWYLKKAEEGDAKAQLVIGRFYKRGHSLKKDLVQAFSWIRKAAEQNDDYAQLDLARMYEDGEGVQQNHTQAAYWYRKSADQGNTTAIINERLQATARPAAELGHWLTAWGHRADLLFCYPDRPLLADCCLSARLAPSLQRFKQLDGDQLKFLWQRPKRCKQLNFLR